MTSTMMMWLGLTATLLFVAIIVLKLENRKLRRRLNIAEGKTGYALSLLDIQEGEINRLSRGNFALRESLAQTHERLEQIEKYLRPNHGI